jgi:Fe-S oxidoreductase
MRSEIVDKGLAPKAARDVHQKLLDWQNPHAEKQPAAVNGQGKVALFVGDDARYLGPETLEAALKLLEAAGFSPVLVGDGRNNGYLASSLGYPETAAKLMQATFDEVERCGADSLFLLTPGDYYAFGQMREDRLAIDLPDGLSLLELVPFLAEQYSAGNLAFSTWDEQAPYAYVDPTHSVRVTTRHDAPRRLLSAVMPGQPQELFWRRERAHPLGNGALQYTNTHIATHLNYSRLADATERGVQLLITEDPAGLDQLGRLASRFRLRVQGLYELLARQLV